MPSRKIISVFIVAVASVASIILVFGNKNAKSAITGSLVSEGPEVKIPENKNWLSDLSPLALNPEEISILAASSSQNLTEEVSQSLMANYLSLRQSGNLNDTSAQNLINQALDFTESSFSNAKKTYTSADIVVSLDNSQAAVRMYGAELGNAFKINKPAQTKNEILLFSEILKSQDKSRVSELKEIAGIYRKFAATLKNIRAPSSYAAMHLEILNSIDEIAGSIDDMAIIFDDPLRSMRGIGDYQGGYAEFAAAVSKIRLKILKEDKVIYKQGESGYYLYYGI